MKILIKDSTGNLIPILIKEEETFRELNQRMEKDHGMKMDFTNLHDDCKHVDLDQNILTYLTENNYEQAAVSSVNYYKEDEEEAENYVDKIETEESSSISLEEVVQIIPEGYRLVTLNHELEGEICVEIEGIKSEDRFNVTDGEEALVFGSFQDQKSEQIYEFSDAVFELNNDTSLLEICRLCATRRNDMIRIFGHDDTRKDIIEKIQLCLPVVIRKSDELPKEACNSCLEKLELCYQFRKTVTEAEKQLLMLCGRIVDDVKRLEKYSKTSELFGRQHRVEEVHGTQEKLRIRHIKDINCDNSLTIIATDFQNANKTDGNKVNPKDSRLCPEKLVRNEIRDRNNTEEANVAINSAVELRSEKRISEGKTKVANGSIEICGKNNDVDDIDGVEDKVFSEQNVDSRKIKCRICGEVFANVKKCYIHSGVHALENYYPCSICEKTFTNEKDCNEHNTEHTETKRFERRVASHVCQECGKKFVTEARLRFHQIYHNSDTKPCYCTKCDKLMASESSLYQHMLNVHTQYKEYCCDICGKQFRAQAQLNAHQRKHKDERPFECTICKKRFYANDILRRHKKLHLPDKPYQCDQCGKRFDRNNTLTKHLLRHQVDAGQSMICHVCNICKEVFADAVTAKIHLEDCATVAEDINCKNILELRLQEIYKCEYCGRCYTEIECMKNHKSCHSEPSPYICRVCDTSYATYNQATAHKTAHKKSSKLTTVKDELSIPQYFACEYCDKRFLHFTNMNIHRRSCSSGKIWTCRYCGAVFENARELSRHKMGETNDKNWLCNECHNNFGSECALEIHRETHSMSLKDKDNFSCSHCAKTFTQKSHLTIHVRSHTGERPYSCDLCEKTYKIKTERDNHRRTHSGERPFECKMCGKMFANTARLREHTRFHSAKRPYSCSLCGQSFKKANARNVHMTIHTGEKPYQCDVCGTSFRRTGDMRKHKRTQHGDKLAKL